MGAERARRWYESRTFHHSEFPPERLASERTRSVSVCVPARNEEATIGPIVADLVGLREAGAIDEVLVIDASSRDRTPAIAADAGADVRDEAELLPEHGEVLGKGDAMWRSLSVVEGDVVVFLDADSEGFGPHFACGLAGPLVCGDTGIEYREGVLPAAAQAGRGVAARGRRARDRAHRPAAAQPLLPRAGRLPPAACGRDGRHARAAAAAAVRHRLRRGDRAADRRLARGRSRRARAGGHRDAPEPPPAARRPDADGLRGAARGRARAWSARGGSARSRTRASCCCRGKRWRRERCRWWSARRWRLFVQRDHAR